MTPLWRWGEIAGARETEDGRRMMVAAVEHGSGLVLGQKEIDDKTNEIPRRA